MDNKNDYSVTVYKFKDRMLYTKYVHNMYTYVQWLQKNNIEWTYLNIYERRTQKFISRFWKFDEQGNTNFITPKPKY